nr:hypothetical protein [Microvirga brassicacearum]
MSVLRFANNVDEISKSHGIRRSLLPNARLLDIRHAQADRKERPHLLDFDAFNDSRILDAPVRRHRLAASREGFLSRRRRLRMGFGITANFVKMPRITITRASAKKPCWRSAGNPSFQ